MRNGPTAHLDGPIGPGALFYRLVLLPLVPAAAVLGGLAATPERRSEWRERRGLDLPPVPPGGVWLHGASVGEARLVRALAREIRGRSPDLPLVASAMTRTGRAQLPAAPEIDGAFFLPLDAGPFPGRALDALRPSVLVVLETELWPRLLAEAAARGVAACIANGRLAPERMGRYRRLGLVYGPLLASLARIGAASDVEAARFVQAGAPRERVVVTGNVKYDVASPRAGRGEMRERFGLSPSRPVVAAGSTGEGEDPVVLDAFRQLLRERPGAFLVLAPRHPERFDSAEAEARRRGLRLHRLSSGADREAAGAAGLLVDTVGQLAELYALADAAFVGGSLVPVGGHNLLEPIAAGAPVLFGPHVHHVAETAAALEDAGAGIRVRDAGTLAAAWNRLVASPEAREAARKAGTEVLGRLRGATARTAEMVLDLVTRARRRPA